MMNLRCLCLLLLLVSVNQVLAAPKTNTWSSRIGFGLNMTRATADTTKLNGDFSLSHKTDHHEFIYTLNAVYGETDENVSENNVNALLQWNQILASDSYLYGNSSFRYDDIANIDYRVLAGAGAGYYIVQRDHLLLALETGPSYLVEQRRFLDDSTAGAVKYYGENDEEFMWRFVQRYKQSVGDASKLWQDVEYLVELGNAGRYLLNFQIGVDVPVNSHFDLRVSVVENYDSQPAPETSSTDLSMRVALVYRLLGE